MTEMYSREDNFTISGVGESLSLAENLVDFPTGKVRTSEWNLAVGTTDSTTVLDFDIGAMTGLERGDSIGEDGES